MAPVLFLRMPKRGRSIMRILGAICPCGGEVQGAVLWLRKTRRVYKMLDINFREHLYQGVRQTNCNANCRVSYNTKDAYGPIGNVEVGEAHERASEQGKARSHPSMGRGALLQQ